MKRSRIGRRVVTVAPMLLVMLVLFAPQGDADHRWQAHWKRSSVRRPISIQVWNQIGEDAAPYIRDVIAKWGSLQAGNWYPGGPGRPDFSFSYRDGGPPSCDPDIYRKGVVVFCLIGEDHPSSEAHITARSDHIQGGIIHIQDVMRHLQGVYCHEFGHTLGLDHSTSAETCMGHTSMTTPNQHDLDLSRDMSAHKH